MNILLPDNNYQFSRCKRYRVNKDISKKLFFVTVFNGNAFNKLSNLRNLHFAMFFVVFFFFTKYGNMKWILYLITLNTFFYETVKLSISHVFSIIVSFILWWKGFEFFSKYGTPFHSTLISIPDKVNQNSGK